MRIFTASLATETNTFSPVPTDRGSFQSAFYAAPGEHPDTPTLCSAVIPVLRRRAAENPDLTVIEGTAAWAEPGGLLRLDVYEELRDEILGQLRAALPVDAVVLGLHGAMVARGLDDCEGDLLARVRDIVGPDVIVAAELDPHSHLTAKRVAAADILAAFLEFPHTDFEERAEHVVDLTFRTLSGEISPVISTFDCRMIDVFPTSRAKMRAFVDKIKQLQGKDGIVSISLIHGFMSGDVPDMGTQMLVVSDAAKTRGDALAANLGREIFAMRGSTKMQITDISDVVDRALQHPKDARPLVVADIWDNPGGGTASDNTELAHVLIDAGITNAGIAGIWDPQAAILAHAAGQGTTLEMRIGGKTHRSSGVPIDGVFEVRALGDPGWQSFMASRVTLGKCAVLRLVGTEIDFIVISNRTQVFNPDIFDNLNVISAQKTVLLIKSTNHFFAGFDPIAAEVFYVAVDGVYASSPETTNYRKLKRPIWPIVPDPFADNFTEHMDETTNPA